MDNKITVKNTVVVITLKFYCYQLLTKNIRKHRKGLPLLRIGALENPAQIRWVIINHPEDLAFKDFITSGVVDFAASNNRAMLKIPLELLEISVNKKFEIELETIEEQVAVSWGKYARAVIKVIIDK